MENIVEAAFYSDRTNKVFTKTLHQYDKGVVLRILGIALPSTYEVHFSNDERKGISVGETARSYEIHIPDVFFESGKFVYVWIYLKEEKTGTTEYQVTIPVEPRPAIYTGNGGENGKLAATLDENDHTLEFVFV